MKNSNAAIAAATSPWLTCRPMSLWSRISDTWLGRGPEEQNRPADGHRAIDFARVDDADHVFAERDDMDIGGREGKPQIRQRLVGERDDVRERFLFGERLDFFFPKPAADEEEAKLSDGL